MGKLKTYNEFVNEALIDAIRNPVKWKKIKNNAKKYQKARTAQALNDVDFAKRKEKAKGNLSPQQKEVLDQANKAKNMALADTASNIAQRMTDLATTDGLKRVAALAKTKANLAANEIVLKAADGEQAKRLKIRKKELTKKAQKEKSALADYEADPGEVDKAKEGQAKEQIATLKKQRKPLIDQKAAEKDPAKSKAIAVKIEEINVKIAELEGEGQAEAKEDLAAAKERLAQETGKPATDDNTEDESTEDGGKTKETAAEKKERERKEKISKKIEDAMKKIAKAKQERVLAQQEEDDLAKKLKDAKGTDAETALAGQVAAADKAGKDIEKAIADLEKSIKDLRKELKPVGESFEYVAESVSQKFARLRPNL